MEFPITKERLRNYRIKEAFQAEVKMRVEVRTNEICKKIENVVLQTNEHKYRHNISEIDKYGVLRTTMGPFPQIPSGGILKELIDSLKTKFPDSKIVLDPLETYILIDWSE